MQIVLAALVLTQAADVKPFDSRLPALAQDKFSGPQKGEKTAGFVVFDVGARKELDFVAEGKGAPTLLVFIHELSRPAAQLMRALDDTAQVKQVRGLRALFVSLSEDRDGAERKLPQVVKSISLKSPLGISVDGKEGPGSYGLNREVSLTILVAKGDKVHANFAILSPNETDAPRIKAAIDEVLAASADAPSGTPDELKAEIVRLREENLRLKEELAALRLQAQRPAPPPGGRRMEPPPAGEKPPQDERLVNHCRRLIQRQASDADLEAAVKDIEAYIDGNAELRKQYVDLLKRVLDLKYGNEAGQAVMKAQLEKHSK
jgi:hypothetical protein